MTLGELFENSHIKIVISELSRSQARIAISAPQELYILRPECLDEDKRGTSLNDR